MQRDDERLRPLIESWSRAELLAFYRDFIYAAGRLRKPPFDDEEREIVIGGGDDKPVAP